MTENTVCRQGNVERSSDYGIFKLSRGFTYRFQNWEQFFKVALIQFRGF